MLQPHPDFSSIPPSKLYSSKSFLSLLSAVQSLQALHKKVVLATGVFDLLHSEHRQFLQKAKQAGEVLVVGIESDVRAKQMKGEGRPVRNQSQRLTQIEHLPYVDFAFILPEDFSSKTRYEEVIWVLRPDIYACSAHTKHQEYKHQVMQQYGGVLQIVHEWNPHVSTTQLLAQGDVS